MNKISQAMLHKKPKQSNERKTRILDFLRNHPIGVLSTISPTNTPRGSVVYFVVGGDDTIAFITKTLTRKYRDIKLNPRVSLVSFEPITQTTASVVGQAEEITEGFEINEIAAAIERASLKVSETGIPAISKLKAGAFSAFKIRPSELFMAVYSRPDRGGYEEIFESIEPYELESSKNNN